MINMARSGSIEATICSPHVNDEKDELPQDQTASSISLEQASTEADSRYESSWLRRVLTPSNCRWDPKDPKPLTLGHCILFATVSPPPSASSSASP